MKDNRSAFFLRADEIDHLTIRYTDFGEKLDTKKAADLIHYYSAEYEEVRNAVGDTDTSRESLSAMNEKQIYDILVIIRTVFLKTAFEESKPRVERVV